MARWLLRGAEVVVGLLFAVLLLQWLLEAVDRARLPPAGRLVAAPGGQMHLLCSGGRRPGSPTVILEGGLGATSAMWARIQPLVAARTQVCSYDRAGTGWSTARGGPRDAVHIARDLYGLLHDANVLPPYVLVGHSFGGLYVRAFAAALPTDVAGLVLLEASHPDQFQRSQQARTEYAELRTMYTVLPWAARLGGLRVSPSCRAPVSFPATAARELHAACAAAAGWTTQQAEFDAIDATMAQVRAAKVRPGLALVVVSGGAHVAASADWGVLQHELGLLSARSSFRIVPGGTHTSLWQDPAQAATCAAAILSVALGPSPSIQNPITENSP